VPHDASASEEEPLSDKSDRFEPPPPTSCPFCRSKQIVTTVRDTKAPLADQYWRCEVCQEVWNPGRLKLIRPQPPRKAVRATERRGFHV
jgi:formate dehydrogenase maturation protein FdhE